MRHFSARAMLILVGIAAVGPVVYLVVHLLPHPMSSESFAGAAAAVAAGLAVVAAAIGAWPALRVLELQEDAGRPSPIPYLDVSSRDGLVFLRVKNFGAAVAYDVRLRWDAGRLRDHDGKEVVELDALSVLVPQDNAVAWIGPAHSLFEHNDLKQYEGTVEFRDVTGRRMSQRFIINVEELRGRPRQTDDLVLTLIELRKLPKQLDGIRDAIRDLERSSN